MINEDNCIFLVLNLHVEIASEFSNKNISFFLSPSSQDALTVYKEAIQKMPRQFAPQSLYNMMGEYKANIWKENSAFSPSRWLDYL